MIPNSFMIGSKAITVTVSIALEAQVRIVLSDRAMRREVLRQRSAFNLLDNSFFKYFGFIGLEPSDNRKTGTAD
jgi:hypothetical protein